MTTAIVLLSGGLDSATALAMSRAADKVCHALSFRYGQRHAQELEAAARVARALGAASHRVLAAIQEVARLGTRAGVEGNPVRLVAPLLHMSKADIVRQGARLGVDFALTLSCYDPSGDGHACGACDSCVLRRRGFEDAGIIDPTVYQTGRP